LPNPDEVGPRSDTTFTQISLKDRMLTHRGSVSLTGDETAKYDGGARSCDPNLSKEGLKNEPYYCINRVGTLHFHSRLRAV